MKISFLPRYGSWAASSRLRVFQLSAAINGSTPHMAVLGYEADADVLVVQKAVDAGVFDTASKHAGRVVYDVDDVIDQSILERASEVADILTVDTLGRAQDLRQRLPRGSKVQHVAVIPDCLDYEDFGPCPVSEGNAAVWFGNWPNFESARPMMQSLAAHGVPVAAISDLTTERANFPSMKLTRWEFDTFPGELRHRAKVAVLSHRGADPHKSSNKIAAAYHLGVPCIVSEAVEGLRLLEMCGLEWTYVTPEHSAVAVWKAFNDPAVRHHAVTQAQPVIRREFASERVAQIALEVYGAA